MDEKRMDEKRIEVKTTLEERRRLAEKWMEPEQIDERRLMDKRIEAELMEERRRKADVWMAIRRMEKKQAEDRLKEISEQRKALMIKYKNLYEEIESILVKHDPMGLNCMDEYEYNHEVDTILPRLNTAKSEIDVLNIVHEEVCHLYENIYEVIPVCKDIAKEIWETWGRHCKN